MRYYRVEITAKDSEQRVYTSLVRGVADPGALNVELDLPVVPFAIPMGTGWVRIWGIGLDAISQSQNLNGKDIKVYGGMSKGLPLANPQQAGLLVAGSVQQAFGNWQGTEMTLDLLIQASTGQSDAPKNIVLDWKAGTPLADAIKNTVTTAFPGYTVKTDISPKLVMTSDQPGFYGTMIQFAKFIKELSASIIGGTYPGVDVVLKDKEFQVYDGTTEQNPKEVAFNDLIGQATWIGPGQIQFKSVMRADIQPNHVIRMPKGQVTTTQQSFSQYRQGSVFQGNFRVYQVRHVGNFRQPDANAWVTVVDASPIAA